MPTPASKRRSSRPLWENEIESRPTLWILGPTGDPVCQSLPPVGTDIYLGRLLLPAAWVSSIRSKMASSVSACCIPAR